MDTADRTYPARLDGQLDPSLNRWKWLIKWLLVIPHVVVLAFLWIAAVCLTFIAGFAILFSGRYPRGIFNFNLAVMRWTWRVSFYAISAFGRTDAINGLLPWFVQYKRTRSTRLVHARLHGTLVGSWESLSDGFL